MLLRSVSDWTVTNGGIYFYLVEVFGPRKESFGPESWLRSLTAAVELRKLLPSACEVVLVCITLAFYKRKIPGVWWRKACSCSFFFPFWQPLHEPLKSCDYQDKLEEPRGDLRGDVGSVWTRPIQLSKYMSGSNVPRCLKPDWRKVWKMYYWEQLCGTRGLD